MPKFLKKNGVWVLYFGFAIGVIATHEREPVFSIGGPYGYGKAVVWLILIGFLAYSLYCHKHENFFRTMKTITPYHWFRQVSLDLYLGLLIPLMLIYLNEGSFLIVCLWFLPIFVMANLATLLYIALNYQSLVTHFIG